MDMQKERAEFESVFPCSVGCNIENCIYKGVSAGDCFGCVEWESKKLSAIMSGQ